MVNKKLKCGIVAFSEGRNDEAIDILITLSEELNPPVQLYHYLAYACYSSKKYNLAVKYWDKLLRCLDKKEKKKKRIIGMNLATASYQAARMAVIDGNFIHAYNMLEVYCSYYHGAVSIKNKMKELLNLRNMIEENIEQTFKHITSKHWNEAAEKCVELVKIQTGIDDQLEEKGCGK